MTLKFLRVSFISENKDKDNIGKYTPISIISGFLKILEKIMHSQHLFHHFSINK